MLKSLFILTDQNSSPLHPDDHGLIEELETRGIEAIPVIWDQFDIKTGSNILIRTPWDYPLKISKFFEFLDTLDSSSCNLINSTKIVRWNLDKVYMKDLETWNIPIVPTRLIETFNASTLSFDYDFPFVVKPRFGASGRDTFLIKKPTDLSLCEVLKGRKVLMQPFIPSIQSVGEVSFICFGGRYSHAVLKTARDQEFRIQQEHGGRVEAYQASQTEVDFVHKVLAQIHAGLSDELPYVRVDVVRHEGELLVMEIEAIEPQLFFKSFPPAIKHFVDALVSSLF